MGGGGQLQYHAAGRALAVHGVAAAFLHGAELGDHAGQRGGVFHGVFDKPRLQHIEALGGVPVAHYIGYAVLRGHGLYLQRAHQVVAGGGEQLELVVGAAAALAREALAVVALGQQVLKINRPAPIGAHQPCIARRGQNLLRGGLVSALVAERERGALRVADVGLVKRHAQDVAILREVANGLAPARCAVGLGRAVQVQAQVADGGGHGGADRPVQGGSTGAAEAVNY